MRKKYFLEINRSLWFKLLNKSNTTFPSIAAAEHHVGTELDVLQPKRAFLSSDFWRPGDAKMHDEYETIRARARKYFLYWPKIFPYMAWGFVISRPRVLEGVAQEQNISSAWFQLVTFPHALHIYYIDYWVSGVTWIFLLCSNVSEILTWVYLLSTANDNYFNKTNFIITATVLYMHCYAHIYLSASFSLPSRCMEVVKMRYS